MTIQAFMQGYKSKTKHLEMEGRDFRIFGTIRLDLEARADCVYIWSIVNLEQGNGQASKVLDWLCAEADKNQVALELFPERMKGYGPGVLTAILKKWYRSRGFVQDARYGFYRREPKMKVHAAQRLLQETDTATKILRYLQSNDVKHSRTVGGVISNDTATKILRYLQSNGFKHRKDTHSLIGDFDVYESADFRVSLKTNPIRTHITIEVL